MFYEEEGCYFGVFHEDVFGAFAVGVPLLGFEAAVFAGDGVDFDIKVVVVEGVVEDHGGAAGVGGGGDDGDGLEGDVVFFDVADEGVGFVAGAFCFAGEGDDAAVGDAELEECLDAEGCVVGDGDAVGCEGFEAGLVAVDEDDFVGELCFVEVFCFEDAVGDAAHEDDGVGGFLGSVFFD